MMVKRSEIIDRGLFYTPEETGSPPVFFRIHRFTHKQELDMPRSDRGFSSDFLCFTILAVATFTGFGCTGDDGGYSGPTGTVSGTVTLDGNPVAANVSFLNTEKGYSASGAADSSGNYSLSTKGSNAIPVGKYQVAVTEPPAKEMSPEEAMEASLKSEDGSIPATDSAIPSKYNSPGGSGLSFEVKEGDNSFEIKMTKE